MNIDPRIDPSGVKPSTTNGDVLQTLAGVAQWGPAASGESFVVTVVNGVPGLVFDNDAQLVHVGAAS